MNINWLDAQRKYNARHIRAQLVLPTDGRNMAESNETITMYFWTSAAITSTWQTSRVDWSSKACVIRQAGE